MRRWIFLGIVVFCAFLALHSRGLVGTWRGFVYPDRDALSIWVDVGEFRSLDACRAAARARLVQLKALAKGDYECGLHCDGGLCAATYR